MTQENQSVIAVYSATSATIKVIMSSSEASFQICFLTHSANTLLVIFCTLSPVAVDQQLVRSNDQDLVPAVLKQANHAKIPEEFVLQGQQLRLHKMITGGRI